jgi:hypothetical protein
MPVNARQAKLICTKAEYELFDASRRGNVEAFTPARLKQKIQRARRLRDKWRDESKRQRREKRGKAAPRSTRAAQSRDNTVKKAELFSEVLERFQKRFKALEAKEAKEKTAKEKAAKEKAAKEKASKAKSTKRPAARKVKRTSVAAKRTGVPKGVRAPKAKAKSESAGKARKPKPSHRAKGKAASKKARVDIAGTQRTLGHVSSRNRRNQTRRDARG